MKICSNCSYEVENDEMEFCPACGKKLKDAIGKRNTVCAFCGEPLQPGVIFCPQCGTKVEASGSGTVQDISEVDFDHLERYDLLTLARIREKLCDEVLMERLKDYMVKTFTISDLSRAEAQTHDSAVQFYLGLYYATGYNCPVDSKKAFEWLKKSAEQGFAVAQLRLGICYRLGEGCEKSYYKAFGWYEKSAKQGYAYAQLRLGNCYHLGYGCKKSDYKGFEWYEKSAKQGYAPGQYNLALCYECGWGCTEDKRKAFEWYTKAAEQGDGNAIKELRNRKWRRYF